MTTDSLTKKVIAQMLKENTGRHFLDSGGAYGRHWERNQSRDFENEKPVNLTLGRYGIEYTQNIYHFLEDSLMYDKGLTNSFYSFLRKNSEKYEYSSYDEILNDWVKYKKYSGILSEYTYNQENNLSQDFIFTLCSKEPHNSGDIYNTEFVVLQIHGGCDARGGFTAPKMFTLRDSYSEFHLLDYARGSIYCSSDNEHVWNTDDNYHWYYQGSTQGKELKDYELVDLEEYQNAIESDEQYQLALEDQMIIDPKLQNTLPLPGLEDYHPKGIHLVKPQLGAAIYYKDNIGYCPICAAQGVLSPLEG